MRHPKNYRYGGGAKLHRYPSVTLTILCSQCPSRRGRYSLARLAHQFGPDITLDDLFDALVRCRYHRPGPYRPPAKYEPKCKARFDEWTGE